MPQMPPAPNVARAVLQFSITGKPIAANVLHFKQAGGGAPDLISLGGGLELWHETWLKAQQHSNFVLNKIILTDLTTNNGQSIEYTTGLPTPGTLTGDPMPNMCALVVSLHTAFRGRSFRGRIYHMGINEPVVTGNSVSAGYQEAIRTVYDKLIALDAPGTDVFNLGVLSNFSNGNLRGQGLFTPCTSVSVNAQLDSQRRRMP